MEKKMKIALIIAAFMIVAVSNSAVLALAPMGPPRAQLGQDRWDLGIEYTRSTMDLEAVGTVQDIQGPITISREGEHEIGDLESNIITARVGYGINENWDAFVRLGIADADGDIDRIFPDGAASDEYKGFDGGFGLAWGIGTKATFWEDEELSWGGLLQITWLEPDDSSITLAGDPVFSGDAELDIWEVQIAAGPTWRAFDNLCIYGGPFLHFVNGDLDLSGSTVDMGTPISVDASGDIEEESQFGGYVGAQFDLDQDTFCFIEGQFTGDAWGIGLGASRRF